MKKHFDRKTAPFLFHRLYHYAILPLTILYLLLETVVVAASALEDARVLSMAACLLVWTGLSIAVFIGFFKWKPFSWYAVLALFCIQWVYAVCASFLMVSAGLSGIIVAFGDLILTAVFFLLILYYLKRKPLFIPAPPPAADQNFHVHEENNRSCQFCVAWLIQPDAPACPVCGAKQN